MRCGRSESLEGAGRNQMPIPTTDRDQILEWGDGNQMLIPTTDRDQIPRASTADEQKMGRCGSGSAATRQRLDSDRAALGRTGMVWGGKRALFG